jgi:hypothetical protein
MKEFLNIALPALLGLISGIVGSLIAPWVHWGIEKRKLRFLSRKKLLEEARNFLNTAPEKRIFRETVIYSQIRQFLNKRTVGIIEGDALYIQKGGRGSGVDNYARHVLDDLLILEKNWNLL